MPFFHHETEEERKRAEDARRQLEEDERIQQASLASLRAGGIPARAQQRLDELRKQESQLFTSDLSVNEFLLAREVGVRPVTQVMGSCVYHVGWQFMPNSYWSSSQELRVLSEALNRARVLALGRMAEEAQRAGAHAVIGVRITRGRYEWGHDLLEFVAFGTAVRIDDASSAPGLGLTNLSGQDFWKLCQAGYWPAGVVAGSTVYYVVAGWQSQMANNTFWGGRANMELEDFTYGLYTARHLAMGRLWNEASGLGAAGIVGTQIDQSEQEREVELQNDQRRTDMIFTFNAIGTAIVQVNREQRPNLYQVVTLKP